jgi:protein-L-isoaspartate(D-aspartate) O-methyltransferase
MEDNYRHKGLRRNLIESLREKGIKDEKVLAAMLAIPRHFFLDKAFEEWAYSDKAFPIGNEQTISQPYTVAYQSVLLEVKKGDKILEIGTGSGYQAAVLSLLEAKTFTVERQESLFRKATKLLKELHFTNIKTFLTDGNEGLLIHAPFDKILLTAAAETIPQSLLAQLKINGTMVIPVGNDKSQTMYKVTKLSPTDFEKQRFDEFKFVPFLKGIVKE